MSKWGVGKSITRKEDDRLLRGMGRFIADINMPGQLEATFIRSPISHGQIKSITIPEKFRNQVFTSSDLDGSVKGIFARNGLPGFRVSEQPILAKDKVRFAGEPIAVCVAATRALAEDIAEQIEVDFEELEANVDMRSAAELGAPLIHNDWDRNVFAEIFTDGDFAELARTAAVKVRRQFSLSRQCMVPLECKGCIAVYDRTLEQLVLTTSTQMPHVVRTGLARSLNIDERKCRVVAPDVGGGFGYKGLLHAEEVCVSWLAMRLGKPIKWLEDRREHLSASANCREHHYDITAYASQDGKLLAVDAVVHVDSGAYSAYPYSSCLEAAQVNGILTSAYTVEALRCKSVAVCTNKPPIVPYRGVARTGCCFAIELTIDAIARELAMDPVELRAKNLPKPEAMPLTTIAGKCLDGGDYPQSLRTAQAMLKAGTKWALLNEGSSDGRLIGVGYAFYFEQGAHGTSVYKSWGIPMIPGAELCTARLSPDGGVEVRTGLQSHGQSMETTFAQVVSEILGVDPANVSIIHGDTANSPYSTGTWGSRAAVMGGGAVAAASDLLAARIKKIGAHLLQSSPDNVTISEAAVITDAGSSVSFREIANAWYYQPHVLPSDVDLAGLEVVAGYKAKVDTGTFSYGAHGAIVAVDPLLGSVEILDYVVVEDGGTLLNPMIADGQIYGGAAQGIGSALYEETPFDSNGQPLASTFADYIVPGASEIPHFRVSHIVTPSPNTRFGQKGIGEGGAVPPPAAIGNAINDALKSLSIEVCTTPFSPTRVLEAIAKAEQQ